MSITAAAASPAVSSGMQRAGSLLPPGVAAEWRLPSLRERVGERGLVLLQAGPLRNLKASVHGAVA